MTLTPRVTRFMLLVFAIAWLGLMVWSTIELAGGTTARSNCQQINVIKDQIRGVLQRQIHTLGQPGTPGYAYYHAHPKELAAALSQTAVSIQKFAHQDC